MKKRLLKEIGFTVIAALLVVLSYLFAGTFFEIWIHDFKLLFGLVVAFYLIIGFYRILNHVARKYREEGGNHHPDVKKG